LIEKKEYLRIARITGVHGLNGRLKIYVITDIPDRFKINNRIFIEHKGEYRIFSIKGFSVNKGKIALLQLDGITDRDSAENYRGADIFIDRDDAEKTRSGLEDGSFYYCDIIGCTAFLDGKPFGEVTDIMDAGSGSILVITSGEKDFMLPFVESMVDTAEIKRMRIDIKPVEGLFDF
jgi:16S rRNA processing protein RimM